MHINVCNGTKVYGSMLGAMMFLSFIAFLKARKRSRTAGSDPLGPAPGAGHGSTGLAHDSAQDLVPSLPFSMVFAG